MKEKTHDLNHDLTFSAHTINCVCHSLRSMFRVLGIYNFGICLEFTASSTLQQSSDELSKSFFPHTKVSEIH